MREIDHNIYSYFQRHCPAAADEVLLETPAGRQYSRADAERESAHLARYLSGLGVKPGDRVAVQVEKSPMVLFLYLACLRAGFVYLPLNTAYTPHELDYFLGDARPRVFIGDPQRIDQLAELLDRRQVAHVLDLDANGHGTLPEQSRNSPAEFRTWPAAGDDVAVILYTSGTTGRPKGAMITHTNLATNAAALRKSWGWQRDDVLLHALPIFHIHGLFVACHSVLLGGGKLLWLPKFDVEQVMQALPRSTVMMGVPTFYTRLLAQAGFDAETCRNMRLFISGSAPLRVRTFEEFQQRSGQTILERYGMTETGMNTSNPLPGPRKPGTVGLPLPGVELRIVDEDGQAVGQDTVGQLQVRGPNVFRGYWRMPDQTAAAFTADGFFRTGDLASRVQDCYITIVGRDKDLIISGGLNVYPREIESVIDQLEGVQESAVFGVPHPDFGEAVCAVVVPADAAQLEETEILTALKQRLANFKVPKRMFILSALPRNTMGKVQKNILRETYADIFQ